MKKLLLLTALSLAFSCENDDESPIARNLNEFEQMVIPFENEETVSFVNEVDEEISVVISAKSTLVLPGQYSNGSMNAGPIYDLMEQANTYQFNEFFRISVRVLKSFNNATNFWCSFNNNGIIGLTGVEECQSNTDDLELLLTDVSVGDITYINVLKTVPCWDNNNANLTQIIYSIERGIEYIEFDDGRFFKRI